MGQSRLHALVMVMTGSFTGWVWAAQGPQSKGQPWRTCVFGVTFAGFGRMARVVSYQAASFESVTSCGPCAAHTFFMMTFAPTATTRAGTAFLHVRQRLVVSWRRRSSIGARG